ncbi:hypothetical protein G7Y89_g3310 [Cudoniella acicularis]|uniref:Uncharacterized protein n=1 Tax=Cudoniella acicularis TaxID=354080 RepID=A0A8H4RSW5_9HELO|nr:hypothetical protein G7Y89_g3310 [Cudoniella acicularis]
MKPILFFLAAVPSTGLILDAVASTFTTLHLSTRSEGPSTLVISVPYEPTASPESPLTIVIIPETAPNPRISISTGLGITRTFSSHPVLTLTTVTATHLLISTKTLPPQTLSMTITRIIESGTTTQNISAIILQMDHSKDTKIAWLAASIPVTLTFGIMVTLCYKNHRKDKFDERRRKMEGDQGSRNWIPAGFELRPIGERESQTPDVEGGEANEGFNSLSVPNDIQIRDSVAIATGQNEDGSQLDMKPTTGTESQHLGTQLIRNMRSESQPPETQLKYKKLSRVVGVSFSSRLSTFSTHVWLQSKSFSERKDSNDEIKTQSDPPNGLNQQGIAIFTLLALTVRGANPKLQSGHPGITPLAPSLTTAMQLLFESPSDMQTPTIFPRDATVTSSSNQTATATTTATETQTTTLPPVNKTVTITTTAGTEQATSGCNPLDTDGSGDSAAVRWLSAGIPVSIFAGAYGMCRYQQKHLQKPNNPQNQSGQSGGQRLGTSGNGDGAGQAPDEAPPKASFAKRLLESDHAKTMKKTALDSAKKAVVNAAKKEGENYIEKRIALGDVGRVLGGEWMRQQEIGGNVLKASLGNLDSLVGGPPKNIRELQEPVLSEER